ncbi:MAG: type IV pilus modification protein PilV [Comamonadaceae bacterium]|nr:type IV pilus modification protein PilV [Comamonadaceae bacterium]
MYRLTFPSGSAPAQHQRGISLLESLIALIVAALGILGVVGMQMRTLTDSQTTVRRAQAIRLIEDLSERLKVNPNAMTDMATYVSDFANTPSPGNCTTNACSHAALATYDLGTWKQNIAASLPLGQANVFLAPTEPTSNRRQLGVMISWRENERDTSANFKDALDAVTGGGGGGTVSCPAGRTCHLQYIPVSARCAPYDKGGSSAATYYCS